MTDSERRPSDDVLLLALAKGTTVRSASEQPGISEATTFRRLRHASGATIEGDIEAEDIDAGITLSRWFEFETRRTYAVLGIDDATNEKLEQMAARRIVSIASKHDGRLTVRDLQRASRPYATTSNQPSKLCDWRSG